MSITRGFAADARAVREARHFVAEELADLPSECIEVVALMVSELASNSVRHANTAFTVDLEHTGGLIRVTVTDDGQGLPVPRSPAVTEPSGRGLRIVESLSDDWGVIRSDESGTAVWFTVRSEGATSRTSRASSGRTAGHAS